MKIIVGASVIFLVFFGIYLNGMAPNITSDDSGELSTVCATLGTAHPSGYPVYTLLGKNFVSLFPFGNFAYRANLLSVIPGALTLALIFVSLSLLSGEFLLINALIVCLLGFARHFWFMSLVTKYYTLNAFFVSLLVLVLVLNYRKPSAGYLYLFALLLGLSFGNHYTMVLFIPSFLIFIFISKNDDLFRLKNMAGYMLFFAAGLAVYLYIFIRAQQNPILAWEDPKTLERFWGIIARSRYGAFNLAQGSTARVNPAILKSQVSFFTRIFADSFGLFNAGLLVLSIIAGLARNFRVFLVFLVMFVVAGPGFIFSTRANLTAGTSDLLERYIYLGFISIPFMVGTAVHSLRLNRPLKYCLGIIFLVSALFLFNRNFSRVTHRNDLTYPDLAKNILKTVSGGAILLSDRADEMEFTLAYLTKALGYRPDVMFVDCNASVSKSIYGDDYYKIWGKPRLAIREAAERQIIATSGRKVYYATYDPGMINITRYPEGMIFSVNEPKQVFPWDEFYVFREDPNPDFRTVNLTVSYFDMLGKYFLGRGDNVRAEKAFEGFKAYYQGSSPETMVAFLYYEKGLLGLAEREYLKAIGRKRETAEIYTNLGAIYEKQNKFGRAVECYMKAIEKDGNYAQAHYNLAVAYWQKQQWAKVIEQLEIVLKLQPQNEEAKRYLEVARRHKK